MSTKQEVFIHPTSCLFGSKPECVVFTELIQTTKSYMRFVHANNQILNIIYISIVSETSPSFLMIGSNKFM